MLARLMQLHTCGCAFISAATHACMKIQPSTLEDIIAPFKSLPPQQLKNVTFAHHIRFRSICSSLLECLLDARVVSQGGKGAM